MLLSPTVWARIGVIELKATTPFICRHFFQKGPSLHQPFLVQPLTVDFQHCYWPLKHPIWLCHWISFQNGEGLDFQNLGLTIIANLIK